MVYDFIKTNLRDEKFSELIKTILSIDLVRLAAISALADDKDGFSPSQERLEALSNTVNIPVDKLKALYKFANFIYLFYRKEGIKTEDVVDDLLSLASQYSIPMTDTEKESKRRELILLFSKKPEFEKTQIAQVSMDTGLPRLATVTSVIDIRVLYELNTTNIIGAVPVAIIKLDLYSDVATNNPLKSEVVFLGMKPDIDKFIESLQAISIKLSSLKKDQTDIPR